MADDKPKTVEVITDGGVDAHSMTLVAKGQGVVKAGSGNWLTEHSVMCKDSGEHIIPKNDQALKAVYDGLKEATHIQGTNLLLDTARATDFIDGYCAAPTPNPIAKGAMKR